MIRQLKPPVYPLESYTGFTKIFLAGSIEMGKAKQWQEAVVTECAADLHWKSRNVLFFNPRRDDWNNSWKNDITNPEFNQQVNWEMDMLERADYRLFYFQGGTVSPVSLLELGKFGDKTNTLVVVDEDYEKVGNVHIFCYRNLIPVYESLAEAMNVIKRKVSIL